MKKIHILILVIMIVVVLNIVVWAIAYPYFSKRIDRATRQGFINETTAYLSENEEFTDKYGSLISAESENEMPIKNEKSEQTEYYMDFVCVTEQGQFHIRVYHTWLDTWTYRFEEIHVD